MTEETKMIGIVALIFGVFNLILSLFIDVYPINFVGIIFSSALIILGFFILLSNVENKENKDGRQH